MPNAINLPEIAKSGPLTHGFFEDFDHLISLDRWIKVIDTGSTALVGDTVGGVVSLTGDGTAEDGTLITTTAEIFKVAEGKPLTMSARVRLNEVATDEMNFAFGLSDITTVDLLVDGDEGPAVSFDGALIFKVGGLAVGGSSTKYSVISSNLTAQTTTQTEHAVVDNAWLSLRIDITPITSTLAEVTFFIDSKADGLGTDWVQMREDASNPRTPAIKHTITITGLLEMHAVLMVKNGSGAAEILDCDWFQCWQKR